MSDPGPQPDRRPALRAGDADRERVVNVLREAAGDGRIDVDELDDRVAAAYRARTHAELAPLTEDLLTPADPAPPAALAPGPTDAGRVVVRPGGGGDRRIVSVMSGSDRRGRWRIAARCLVVSFMGGAELDLNDAELSDARTTIRMIGVMGGNSLRLPAGVDVQVSRFAFMGGNDVRLTGDPPPSGAPVIHVKLFAFMGGNDVKQGRRRLTGRQRRAALPGS